MSQRFQDPLRALRLCAEEIRLLNSRNGRGPWGENPACFAALLSCALLCATCVLSAQTKIDFNTARLSLNMVAIAIEDGKIVLDGVLGEPQWTLAEPATDFLQRLPYLGQPATERTEARILYDRHNLYVGVHCFDSLGEKGITIKDIRPDFNTLGSDGFQVVFDTFDDDRNCFLFGTNPAGARFDMQIGSDGTASNTAWNGIWYVVTQIDSEGWHAEMAIPFTTLRFQKSEIQTWGVNFERRVRRKAEDSYWSPLPASYRLGRISLAGKLTGLEGIRPGRNLQIKPYVSGRVSSGSGRDADFEPDIGGDAKWGIGSQFTLDLTANTDFSQVEADEEQINLTRYSLFFPEKRDFFLENASLFKVGRSKPFSPSKRPDVMPFFTRQIGISDDERLIPILGGARLSGRADKYTMSMLSMVTDHIEGIPRTSYSMIRARRDILKKSDIGGFFTNKQSQGGVYNRTYGTDVNFNFFQYLDISSYLYKTDTSGVHGKDWASYFEIGWKDDLIDLAARRVSIDENFDPQMGYVSRTAIRKNAGDFALTFRPRKRLPWIRYLGPAVLVEYITDPQNNPESKDVNAFLDLVFRDGSQFQAGRISSFERHVEPFNIHLGQMIEPGDYDFDEYYVSFVSDRSRMFAESFQFSSGSFYDGRRRSYQIGGDFQPGYHFKAGLTWSYNDVHLPSGDFTTKLLGARLAYAFNTGNFFNALIQYNSDTKEVSSNIRLNLFHTPLNDFYLVYNERRSSTGELLDRALIAKLAHIFSF